MNAGSLASELIAELAAHLAADDEAQLDEWAQFIAATHLSADVAGLVGSDLNRVYDALTLIPDNMLSLLHSPQGWTALAAYVAADLGVSAPNYQPQIH